MHDDARVLDSVEGVQTGGVRGVRVGDSCAADISCIFFFSSRRRHTRLTCDWSSDVCSSDLLLLSWNTSYTKDNISNTPAGNNAQGLTLNAFRRDRNYASDDRPEVVDKLRSEERRVGKESRSRWSAYH